MAWNDLNGDGIQDVGEPGLEGVTVNLLDATGTSQLDTATTGPDGLYSFTVAAGTYVVEFIPPANATFSPQDAGGDDTLDSDANPADGRTAPVTVADPGTDDTVDAGFTIDQAFTPGNILVTLSSFSRDDLLIEYTPTGTVVQGHVIPGSEDFSRLIAKDIVVDDLGRAQIFYGYDDVRLSTYDSTAGTFVETNVPAWDMGRSNSAWGDIDALGNYVFANEHTDDSGTQDGIIRFDTADMSFQRTALAYAPIDLTVGLDGLLYTLQFVDFSNTLVHIHDPITMAEQGTTNIADRVHSIAVDGAGHFYAITDTGLKHFDATGSFVGGTISVPGRDDINIAPDGTLLLTTQLVASITDTSFSPPTTFSLPGDVGHNLTGFATFFQPAPVSNAVISDFVWEDLDRDGIQDGNEPGLDGVTVNLLDAGGNPTGQSTTTSGGGQYSFNVAPGTYIVEFEAPPDFEFTAQDATGDDTLDSDANPANGRTAQVIVGSGEIEDTVDAGLFRTTAPNVYLDASQDLIIEESMAGDAFDTVTISVVDVSGTNHVRVHDPNNPLVAGNGTVQVDANTVDAPLADITGGDILVDTLGLDDSLTIDFGGTGGDFVAPVTGIRFDGGEMGESRGDTLILQGGGTFAQATFNFDNVSGGDPDNGTIDISGNALITYTGLEPIFADIDATDVTLNYGPAAETVFVEYQIGQTVVDSTAGEIVGFNNPTGTLTINGGPPSGLPGDTLVIDADEGTVTDDGSTFTVDDNVPIQYSEFENITLVTANIIVNGSGENDLLDVTATSNVDGSYVLTRDVDGHAGSPMVGPTIEFVDLEGLTFNSLAGDDTFVVNNPPAGVLAPDNGLRFPAGTGMDELELVGGGGLGFVETYRMGSAADEGTINTGDGSSRAQTVHFTGVSRISDNATAASLTVNSAQPANTIGIVDGPLFQGDQTIEVNFDGDFAPLHFANKMAVTVNGSVAADTINVDYSLAAAGLVELAVNGDGPDLVTEVEPNDSTPLLPIPPNPDILSETQDIDPAGWNLNNHPYISESTTIPHISILGDGDGTADYYSFTAGAGDRGIFDIDEQNFDTALFLYDSDANLLVANDADFNPDPGDGVSGSFDALIDYTFTLPGTYVIAVAEFRSSDSLGYIAGNLPDAGDVYTLQVSLENHAPGVGGDPVAEVEPNNSTPLPPPHPTIATDTQSIDDAPWNLSADTSIIDSTTVPHISIAGSGNDTADYYSFTASAGDRGIFDVDAESFDSYLFLYDADGNLLISDDDGPGEADDGSGGGWRSSLIDYTFLTSGTFVICVAAYPPDLPWADNVPGAGDTYTLHVSLDGKTVTAGGDDTIQVHQSTPAGVTTDLSGNGGNDSIVLAAGVTITGTVDGGSGTDTLDYTAYTTDIVVDLSGNSATNISGGLAGGSVGSSIENVLAGAGSDLLTGDIDDNTLGDGAGNDVLDGGAGNDTFRLEPGSDDYLFDVSGSDTVDFSLASAGVTFDMDLVGFDADGVVEFGTVPPVDVPAPQDVFGDGSATVSLMRSAALGQTELSPSPFENVVGSQFDDFFDIDPLSTSVRSVDGNLPVGVTPGDTLRFDAQGRAVIDTGDSLSAAGAGTVHYASIETLDVANLAPRIIDNGDLGWSFDGRWRNNRTQGYENDIHFAWQAQPSQVASWTFDGVTAGDYLVSVTWTAGNRHDRADDVLYSVLDGNTPLGQQNVDQTLRPEETGLVTFFDDGVWWAQLPGTYAVAGNSLVVELSGTGAEGFAIADAARIDRVVAGGVRMQVRDETGATVVDEVGRVDFGTTLAGNPVDRQFTIENLGTETIELGPLNLPVGFIEDAVDSLPASVAPGTTETFTVAFDPQNDPRSGSDAGAYSGQLSFDFKPAGASPGETNTFNFLVTGRSIGTQDSPDGVIDNEDEGFEPGGFRLVPHDSRGYGRDYRFDIPGGEGTATWTFDDLPAGIYQVSTTYFAFHNRSTQAPFTLIGDTTEEVAINQRIAPEDTPSAFMDEDGVFWTNLHSGLSVTGGTLTVQLDAAEVGYVIADAVRVQRISDDANAPEIAIYRMEPPGVDVEVFDGATVVNFGTPELGQPVQRTFEIRNLGGSDLEVYPLTLSYPAGFSLIATSYDPLLDTVTIPPSGSESFTLQFDATLPGSPAGLVSLENSDADENPFDFGVTGSVGSTIIDDGDPGYDATGFRRVGPDSRFFGRDYEYLTPGADGSATWSFSGLTAGKTYQVALSYYGYHNRATDAPLTITGGYAGPRTVYVNQRTPADDFSDAGVFWENVAIVTLDPQGDGSLTVELAGSETGYAIADAVRVEALYLPTMDLQLVDNGSTSRVQYQQVVDFGTALQMTAPETKVFIVTNGGELPLVLSQPAIDSDRYRLDPYYDPDTGEVINDPATGMPVQMLVLPSQASAAFSITQLTDMVPAAPGAPFDATVSIESNDVSQRAFEFFVTGEVQHNFRVVDDGDPGYDAGNFRHRPGDGRFYGNDYDFQTPGTDGRASWTFVGLDPGMYRVSATWFAWFNRATNAAFRAFDGEFDPGDTGNLAWTVPVDQTVSPDGTHAANWQEIGLINVTGDTVVVDVLSGLSDGFVIADAVRLDFLGGGGPLHATTTATTAGSVVVTRDAIDASLAAAVDHWTATGLSESELARLGQVQVQVTQLPGTMLGWTSGLTTSVWIDADAAGHGWSFEGRSTHDVDGLPLPHSAFRVPHSVDLLTVMAHELGHVLGRDHDEDHDVMSATLEAGDRLPVISDPSSVMGYQTSVIRHQSWMKGDRLSMFRNRPFDLRDAVFARWEQTGAAAHDDNSVPETGDSSVDLEDSPDLWELLL